LIARAPFDQLVGWSVIIGTVAILVTLALTIMYGHGPWRDRRRRPNLSLMTLGDPNWQTMPPDITWVTLQLALRNEGNGIAENWSVRISSPVGAEIMRSDGKRGPVAEWATDSPARAIDAHDPQAYDLDSAIFILPPGGPPEWYFSWQVQATRMRRVHGFILVVPRESVRIQRDH
jgi:hypothetical protein